MKYSIMKPDGRRATIEGPPGKTRSEVIEEIQRQEATMATSVSVEAPEQSLSDKRAELSEGATLRFGPWDTGVGIPQWLNEGLAGAGREAMELVTAGTHQGTSDELLDDSIAASVGSAGTDILASVLAGGALKKLSTAAQAAPKLAKGAQWLGNAIGSPKTAAQALTGGAMFGGLLGDGGLSERAQGAGQGAVGGIIGHAIPKGLERVISPKAAPAARELLDADVPLTPGQIIGGRFNEAEQQLSSIPFAGAMTRGARRESVKQWNRSKINEALQAAGEQPLPKNVNTGEDAFQYAHKQVSDRYDDVLERMPIKVDEDFASLLQTVPDDWDLLDDYTKNQFKWGMRQIEKLADNTGDNGRNFKRIDSRFRDKIKNLTKGDRSPKETEAGQLLQDMHYKLKEIASNQNPVAGIELAGADKAYAMLRTAGAASVRDAKDELFTPKQLRAEIKKRADIKKMYTGKAPGYKELKPALDLLPDNVPDSGTAGRALIGSLLAGGSGLIDPSMTTAGLIAGMTGLYSPSGTKAFRAYMKPSANRNLIGMGMGALAPAGGLLGRSVGREREF